MNDNVDVNAPVLYDKPKHGQIKKKQFHDVSHGGLEGLQRRKYARFPP